MARQAFSTTIDEEILRELTIAANYLDRPVNELIEEGARKLLDALAAPDLDARFFIDRRDEPEEDLLAEIEKRVRRIREDRGASSV